MPSQQLELKSDITNLFEDLESIAKETKVHAPHVPKIEQADITELFSGLNVAHEEAKVEVELRLSLDEKNNLDTFANLVDTFSEITKPEATWPNEWPEEEYPKQKPIDESVIQSLEELFSTTTHIEPVELVKDSEEPTSVEKTATLIDKVITNLDSMGENTHITEEVNQITTLRKEFDNFRSLIAKQVSSAQMSGAGGGEVRLEFMDDVDRSTAKVDGKFLKFQSSTGKFVGADAGVTNEQLQDVVGAMISSNTESGITVTYEDSDGTLDFVIGTLNQNTTGSAATLTTARTIAGVSFDGSSNITIASTDLSNTSAITLLTSTQTLTNKTLTSPVINTGISGTAFLDEDDLSSDSATKIASQQSIKAYVDAAELRTRAFAIAIGAGL